MDTKGFSSFLYAPGSLEPSQLRWKTKDDTWEFAKIRDPNIDSNLLGLLLQGHPRNRPLMYRGSHLALASRLAFRAEDGHQDTHPVRERERGQKASARLRQGIWRLFFLLLLFFWGEGGGGGKGTGSLLS